MLHLLTFLACALLMHGVYTVDAVAFGRCMDRFLADVRNGTETCKTITEFLKCFMLETNMYKDKDEVISQYKIDLERSLADQNVSCDIDVLAIADELRENDRKGIQHTTTRPKGFKNATTFGECADTFAAEDSGDLTCAKVTYYLKCIFRVSNVQNLTSTIPGTDTLEQIAKRTLDAVNLGCDINLAALFDEVRQEEAGENVVSQQQGNENNGADMVVRSFPFVTLLMLTIASLFVFN